MKNEKGIDVLNGTKWEDLHLYLNTALNERREWIREFNY